MKDRLERLREHYMDGFMSSQVSIDFELTFEEYLLIMLEGAEAAFNALMELSGMETNFDFFYSTNGLTEEEEE